MSHFILLQQTQNDIRHLVCLGQHRCSGLLQDLTFGQSSRFASIVGILDAAAGRSQVGRQISHIANLTTQRSELGALQNQMDYAVSNVTELSANLTSARSRVQDTDYASETASLTKGQILQQAATAMLAQANQMPNVILSLLK